MTLVDWIVVALYFGLVALAAVWPAARSAIAKRDSSEYFLASRHTGWVVVGASLFASNIGSEHLVGLAGTGAANGLAVGQFEVLASLILLLLGWVFVPFYLRSGVYTMPEFLERRYSAAARRYLAVVSIIAHVITKISVTIFAGGVVFETLMGLKFWTGALVAVVATGLYTVLGGLRAVLYTDLLQTVVLIGGSVTVTVVGIGAVGGWDGIRAAVEPGWGSPSPRRRRRRTTPPRSPVAAPSCSGAFSLGLTSSSRLKAAAARVATASARVWQPSLASTDATWRRT